MKWSVKREAWSVWSNGSTAKPLICGQCFLRKLSLVEAEQFISSSDFGASIFFSGTVRNNNNNKSVTGITYDSHDSLVIKSFEEIYNEADQKLNIKNKAVFIEHAKGYLNLGEISIIIAVACKHRDEAYILSRYIIEEIKKDHQFGKRNTIKIMRQTG